MHRPSQQGFSLIEVLVALVIISISLGAMLQASQTNVANTITLKDTILAQNHAWNYLLLAKPLADIAYDIEVESIKTEVKQIKKKVVNVERGGRYLSTLTRFVYESR